MPEQTAGTAVADRDQARPAPDAPAPSGFGRWIRSPAALLTLAGVVLAAGLFVGGIALGRATTHSAPPASSGTATTAGGGCTAGNPGQCIAFTSGSSDTVTVGTPFTFQITTSGSAGIRIRKTGRTPKGVHFTNNHDGTATLAGTVIRARRHAVTGTYSLTFTAVTGNGATRQVVRQDFSLIVTR
jgi:hypothetical protein